MVDIPDTSPGVDIAAIAPGVDIAQTDQVHFEVERPVKTTSRRLSAPLAALSRTRALANTTRVLLQGDWQRVA